MGGMCGMKSVKAQRRNNTTMHRCNGAMTQRHFSLFPFRMDVRIKCNWMSLFTKIEPYWRSTMSPAYLLLPTGSSISLKWNGKTCEEERYKIIHGIFQNWGEEEADEIIFFFFFFFLFFFCWYVWLIKYFEIEESAHSIIKGNQYPRYSNTVLLFGSLTINCLGCIKLLWWNVCLTPRPAFASPHYNDDLTTEGSLQLNHSYCMFDTLKKFKFWINKFWINNIKERLE
jgi:hypothetical protein